MTTDPSLHFKTFCASSSILSICCWKCRPEIGCAGSFVSKQNDAKLKLNLFRFEAKQRASFALFRFEAKRQKEAKQNETKLAKQSKRKQKGRKTKQ